MQIHKLCQKIKTKYDIFYGKVTHAITSNIRKYISLMYFIWLLPCTSYTILFHIFVCFVLLR